MPYSAIGTRLPGRDRGRLERLVRRSGAPVRLLGRVDDDALPAFYGCADVFAMLARGRWAGLEQEGFGIVFLEAAACGVPQVAGASGGVAEAVADDDTGLLVAEAKDAMAAAAALGRLLDDPSLRASQGEAARNFCSPARKISSREISHHGRTDTRADRSRSLSQQSLIGENGLRDCGSRRRSWTRRHVDFRSRASRSTARRALGVDRDD